jgi:glucosamine--fructose-6-phosphate aminotransferase (isomerizing)
MTPSPGSPGDRHGPPGHHMSREMAEQPEVLRRLNDRRAETLARVRDLVPEGLPGILLVARGSSDNAAIYGRYLLELATRRPVALVAPSLWTRYAASTKLDGWLVVAISQSGATPEIADTLERMQQRGAATIALTNDDTSRLAEIADVAIDLGAGDELSVPATKTFLASLLALVHVGSALGDLPWGPGTETALVPVVQQVLEDSGAMQELADRHLSQSVHIGRGFTFPIALEAALKVKETCGTGSTGYAVGDLMHGPVASLGPSTVAFGYGLRGPTLPDVVGALEAAQNHGADAVLLTDADAPWTGSVIRLPSHLPEPLAAIPLAVRGQQLALFSALRLGRDPDQPGGLTKVTSTR